MAMTCFNRMNPETGRRLMPQKGPHLSAHFTIMLGQIRMADRSFGANGSSLVHSDKKRCDDASHSNSTACEIHRDAYLFRESFGSGRAPSRRLLIVGHTYHSQEGPPSPRLRRDRPESFRGWRRGELNPCPRRYPREHLHVYPAINSEEPSHAPAHYLLPSVHEFPSPSGAVAPPFD